MKANELRVGNIVKVAHYLPPEPLDEDAIGVVMTYRHHLKEMQPIPLTEEWLLKFGFEKDTYASTNRWILYNHDEGEVLFEISGSDSYGWVRIFTTTNGIEDTDTHFKHVHQLQNLYFALTGEELKLKEIQNA